MITGTLTENKKSDGFDAEIHAMTFDLTGIRVVTNSFKTKDNHPDYHLEFQTPRGRALRIGSMWKAVSEKWQIVPLAGGKTDQVMLNGKIELLEDDALVGSIGSYDFDIDFVGLPNDYKASDDHPDYHIEVKSPAGVAIRMGSIWRQASDRTGAEYLSMSFYSPFGGQHRANGLRREGDPDGLYEIVSLTGPKAAAA